MREVTEDEVKAAIWEGKGALTLAAELLKVSRLELLEYVTGRLHLLLFVQYVREEMMDNSRLTLGEALESGAPWAIRYTLKTIGAKRGYGAKETERGELKAGKEQPVAESAADSPGPFSVANPEIPPAILSSFAAAVHVFKGHLTLTAKALGMTRPALKALIASCPRMQAERAQVTESLVDIAECMLGAAIQEKKPWAVTFALNTLGRKCGFGPPAKPKRRRASTAGEGSAEPTAPVADTVVSDMAGAETVGTDMVGAETMGFAKPSPTLAETAPQKQLNVSLENVLNPNGRLNGMANLPTVAGNGEIARNAQCPCHSGRKYKRCC